MAKKKNEVKFYIDDIFTNIASGITGVTVFVTLVIFPLYTHNMYFDILGARYLFFKLLVVFQLVLLAILGVIYLLIDNKSNTMNPNGSAFNRLVNLFRPENLIKHINLVDVFFIVLIISMSIGTCFSEFLEESYYGNAGRYQGLECWLLYILFYFMVSRTFKFKRFYLDFALIAGTFACLWGISDFFYMDIFGFFRNVSEAQKMQFTSSIGNLNTYTNYTLMIFAISSALFMIEKNVLKSVFYALVSLVAITASIFGISDNVLLGFAAFFIMAPFILFKDKRAVVRFFYLSSMIFFGIFLYYVAIHSGHRINPFYRSIFSQVSEVTLIRFMFIPFLLIAILLNILYSGKVFVSNGLVPQMNQDQAAPKIFIRIYLAIVLIVFVSIIYILYDVNVSKNHIDIWNRLPFVNQLTFNDDWGTHRGHNWKIAFINFTERFNWFKRLFGHGPDTYLIITETSFYDEMVNRYKEIYDSAHNELINYLMCEGIIGLITYLGAVITSIIYGVKCIKENREVSALVLCVVVYLAQSVVNIAIPITTPVYFVSMFMIVAVYLNSDLYKNKIAAKYGE